jgi:hypothetical protein
VSGTGVSTAAASPSAVEFGNVPVGTTATRDVSISVDAGYSVQIASGSGINVPFGFAFDTCGAGGGFAGPGTCNVKQSFHPTSATESSGTTNVFECPVAGGSCIAIPYTVHGTGILSATTTTLTSLVNPSLPGQAVTFTATVASASGTPSGSVTFTDGATTLGTVALSGGSASFTISTLALGSHDIHANYSGATGFAPSSSNLTQVVHDTTTTTLVSSLNPSLLGQAVTFTANVASGSGAVVPTGVVTFSDGATVLGTVPLAAGSAQLTVSTLTLGSHVINASYAGAPGLAASSANLTQVVQDTTATTLTSSVNPSIVGQPVTFTAHVTPSSGIGTPTGSVTFSDGSTTLGTVTLSGGNATFTTSSLSVGTHTIAAAYAGNATYRPSSASLQQVVKGVTALLADLEQEVTGIGPGNSLLAKVEGVQASVAAGNNATACSKLDALLNEISAQSGKSLTTAQAQHLTAEINVIRSLIPCA